MAQFNKIDMGPKLDLTRDHLMYDRFRDWKEKIKILFAAAFEGESEKAKCSYIKYWLGEQGLPLIHKRENTGDLIYTGADPNGYKTWTYWNLLENEFRPKANKIISVLDLWTNSKQNSMDLNEWITKVYNQVELCNYRANSKDRIICDVLIVRCASTQARDKIIRKGEDVDLRTVVEILQTENATSKTMQTFDSTATANVHYVKYDRKKKSGRNYSSHASSTDKKYYRCRYSFEKEHMTNCPAKDVECWFCSLKGHFAKCCGKAGNFPKGNKGHRVHDTSKKDDSTSKKNLHAIQAVQENTNTIKYWNEDGNLIVQEISKEN